MANTRIVTLGPPVQPETSVSAFEEAFGEYSEARGRGRARRKKRRLERIASRKEVRAARREERKERKVGRQEVKQAAKEARIAKRRAAQAARQAKRLAAMQARQEKRTERKKLKLQRQALGDSPEAEMDDTTMIENGAGVPPTPTDTGSGAGPEDTGAGPGAGPEDTGAGPQDTGAGPEDTGYLPSDTGSGAGSGSTSGGGYQDQEEWGGGGYQGPTWGDEGDVEEGGYTSGEEEGGYEEEEGGYGDEGEGDSGFDGELTDDADGLIAMEDTYNEFNDEGRVRINPSVKEVASKIEWNKELISRLQEKARQNPRLSREINSKITSRQARIDELTQMLEKYKNFDGEFENGIEFTEYSEAAGRRYKQRGVRKNRAREVMMAKRMAQTERASVSNSDLGQVMRNLREQYPPAVASRKFRQYMNSRNMQDGGDVTPVEAELNPEIQRQRIVIPADEKASAADGLSDDFGEPVGTFIDMSSNFDGEEKNKINWTSLAIGVGIGVLAIWAVRKYKIFDK